MNQHNDAIENELKFDNKFILSSATKDPLPVVTVRLRGSKKHRATITVGVKFWWDIGATNIMNKRQHT